MKPYYETPNGKLYHGDCLEMLEGLESKSVDMVFNDCPFNVNKSYQDNRANYNEWCESWISACFNVLSETGSFYLMTLTKHLEWKMPIMAKFGKFINLIAWKNTTASRCARSFWLDYQPILFYGKSENYKFNRYAETISGGQRRWGGYSDKSGYKGQMKDSWFDIPMVYAGSIKHHEAVLLPGTNKKAHECQMPSALARRAVLFSTDKGDVVLDIFMGSGSTAVACEATNRRWIGIEIEEKYCEIAAKRIEKECKQRKLF